MVDISLCLQVHQPFRIRHYSVFEVGKSGAYFDEAKNQELTTAIAGRCYLPAARMFLDTLREQGGSFRLAIGMSGVAIDQFEKYTPEVIDSFRALARTGWVEFLGGPYYHSFSSLYSEKEFERQVMMHKRKIMDTFGMAPKVFSNAELLYSNNIARMAESMGFFGIIANGAPQALGWMSPNHVYKPIGSTSISLLLKNPRLSEDIQYRFSDPRWNQFPLSSKTFAHWLAGSGADGPLVNLFLPFEIFGEHNRKSTGIFNFMRNLPGECRKEGISFVTPQEALRKNLPSAELDIHHPIINNSLEGMSAWFGNPLQHSAISRVYSMEEGILSTGDAQLAETWRMLQTSDHFQYMSTAGGSASHLGGPYDSFMAYMNIMSDLAKKAGSGVPKACQT